MRFKTLVEPSGSTVGLAFISCFAGRPQLGVKGLGFRV